MDVVKIFMAVLICGGLIAFMLGFTGLIFGYYFVPVFYDSPILFGLMGWGLLPIAAVLAAEQLWGPAGLPAAGSAVSLLIWYRWRRSDKRRAAARR